MHQCPYTKKTGPGYDCPCDQCVKNRANLKPKLLPPIMPCCMSIEELEKANKILNDVQNNSRRYWTSNDLNKNHQGMIDKMKRVLEDLASAKIWITPRYSSLCVSTNGRLEINFVNETPTSFEVTCIYVEDDLVIKRVNKYENTTIIE